MRNKKKCARSVLPLAWNPDAVFRDRIIREMLKQNVVTDCCDYIYLAKPDGYRENNFQPLSNYTDY